MRFPWEKAKRRDNVLWGQKSDIESKVRLRHEPLEERRLLTAWVNQGPSPSLSGQVENISPNNEVIGAIHAAVAHPTDADVLWVGAVNGGVWRTDNATAASPTWTPQTDGQESLSIGALELDPTDATNNTLVTGMGRFSSFGRRGGSLEGILVTNDGGATWTNPGSVGLVGQNVSGVAARGSEIVVSGNGNNGSGGLFRSTDGGATFSSITNGLPGSSPDIFDLVVDPSNPLRLFASVEDQGIYRSDDFGISWTNISSGDPTLDGIISTSTNNNTEMAVASNGRLYVMVMLNSQANYIGYTDNPTAPTPTWTAMDLPRTPESNGDIEGLNPREKPGGQGSIHSSIRVDPSDPNTVYVGGDRQDGPFTNFLGAGTFTGRLFRGDTTIAATGVVPSPQWEHLTHSDSIAGISGGGTASSSAPHADSREIVFDANGDLIEVDDGGIYRRTNPGDNTGDWFSINGNLAVTEQHDIGYDSLSNIIISGNQDTGTTQQQFEGSAAWDSVSTADGGDIAVDDSGPTSYRYSSFQNLGSFRRREYDSNNNLISQVFLASIPDPQFVTPVELNAVDPTRLAIGGTGSVYESFNQGLSNSPVSGSTGANSDAIAYGHVSDPDLLVVGDSSQILVRDSFVGNVMAPTPTAFPGGSVRDIVLDPTEADAYYVVAAGGIYQTLDGGTVWNNITGNLFSLANDFRSIEFVEALPEDGLIVGTEKGVYFADSSDFTFWSELGTGLPNVLAYDIDYDPSDDLLVVGTLGRGAWTLSDTSVEINGVDLPEFAAKDFKRLEPFGSLVSASTNNRGTISFIGDTDDFTFLAEAGENFTAIIQPLTGTSTLTAEFVGLGAPVAAGAPGDMLVLPAVEVLADGTVRIRISGNLDAAYQVDIYRNTTLEALVVDSGVGNELEIDDAYLTLGSGRTAVVGSSTGLDTDRYTFDFSSAIGSSVDIVLAGHAGADFSLEQLDLIAPSGLPVAATAVANPLGPNADNFDLAILGFTITEAGDYSLELSSAVAGDYTILVTQSLAFDSEPNTSTDPLTGLDNADGALGFLDVSIPVGGLNFVIDSGLTVVTIGGAITDVNTPGSLPITPQQPGSDTTNVAGSVRGSVSPNAIQFLGGSIIDAIEQPGPFNPGNSPADVALQVELLPGFFGFIAVRDVLLDVASGPIPVDANGNFDGEGITVSVTGGSAALEVVGLVEGEFDITGGFATNMSADTATILTLGETLVMTVPIDTTIELEIPDTTLLAEIRIVGQVVATATLNQDTGDHYEVDLVTGQQIVIATDTPLDGGLSPENSLDPELYLFGPSGSQLAFDLNSAPDGKNTELTYVATESGSYRVEVRANSGIGEYLLAVNTGPTATITGPTEGVRGQPRLFTLEATDTSLNDQAADFTFQIDWDNDGNFDRTVVGPSGVAVEQVFPLVGSFDVRVVATDTRGASGSEVFHNINISAMALQPDPNNPGTNDLAWGGTQAFDAVFFLSTGPTQLLVFEQFLNTTLVNQFTSFSGFNGRVLAYGQEASDVIVAEFLLNPSEIYGGPGNDVLVGGSNVDLIDGGQGNDIILGGIRPSDGNDTLLGREGRDILIGHLGADMLFGGAGDDLLLVGEVYFDDLPTSLFAIQAEWLSGRDYATRVANISGTGVGPRLNGDVFLIPWATVSGDLAVDQLTGDDDLDWFLYTFFEDITTDVDAEEIETDI